MASKFVLPIIRRAQRGDALSQYRLGCIYLDGGEGLAANEDTAYMWLSRAAMQGWQDAWLKIGERVSPHVADGDRQLARWYGLAAESGSLRAQRMLAQLLVDPASNRSGACGYAAARALLEQAAASGDAEACRDLGRLLLATPGSHTDEERALNLLVNAYERGRHEVARDLADLLWNRRALVEAQEWYERCPQPFDAERDYRLGMLNALLGKAGNRLLERAARAGHLKACEQLGLRLATGSVEHRRDLKKAASWLEPAALQGSARAAYLLATIHHHRPSGAFDKRCGTRWLFQAARLGHGRACLQAGKAILKGLETGRLPTEAATEGMPDVAAAEFLVNAERDGQIPAANLLVRLLRPIGSDFRNDPTAWSDFAAVVGLKDLEMAARVRLAHALGLTARELLAVDPRDCDLGSYFVVSVPGKRSLRRRLVAIRSPEQRRTIDETKEVLTQLAGLKSDNNFLSDFRSNYLKLRLLARQYDHSSIRRALFPRIYCAETRAKATSPNPRGALGHACSRHRAQEF